MLHPRPTILAALARTTLAATLVTAGLVPLGEAAAPAIEPRHRAGETIVLNDNGAWSWFEDERAVVDPVAGTLLVSSVANSAGSGGAARHGNVEVVAYQVETGGTARRVLHGNLEGDDHDSAALYVRSDGRYVAMYSRHGTDDVTRWRVSARPGAATAWGPERSFDHGAPATYSNVYPATGDDGGGLLYGFVRSDGDDPSILVSADEGTTWRHGGRLLDGPGRPYVRYGADSAGRIHVLTTEQHPLKFANGIYHGVVDHGQLRGSDGTLVDDNVLDEDAVRAEQLTTVFPSGIGRAWTVDLHVDGDGHPYAAFSVHTSTTLTDGRRSCAGLCYYYATFDGSVWQVHLLADAGSALSDSEPYYSGLIALHPHDPHRLFISTDTDPSSGAPLVSSTDGRRHHEIFEGRTTDGGATWTWDAVTSNSAVDNIRPIVPSWDADHTALLWLRGTYRGYQDYDLAVVAVLWEESG